MKAVVTGATGFVGPRLLALLQDPLVLSRSAGQGQATLGNKVTVQGWKLMDEPAPVSALNGRDVVFHLAGDPVASGRWTAAKKQAIRESRVVGTKNLVAGIKACSERPKVLVCASAVGYYGDRGDELLTEKATPADDYLAEVCVAWEREAMAAAELGVRVVPIRIGIVLGRGGGALAKMLLPFKLCLGGPLGNGKHWMPWIHVDDLAAMMIHAATNDSIHGPMNGVAPNVVTNKEFTKALASALHRPAILPTPYLPLRLIFGEFAKILFASQRVVPEVANKTSFEFQYPTIAAALDEIIAGKAAPARQSMVAV